MKLAPRGRRQGWTCPFHLQEGVDGFHADLVSFFGVESRGSVRFKLWTLDPAGLCLRTPYRGSAFCSPHIFRPGNAPARTLEVQKVIYQPCSVGSSNSYFSVT